MLADIIHLQEKNPESFTISRRYNSRPQEPKFMFVLELAA